MPDRTDTAAGEQSETEVKTTSAALNTLTLSTEIRASLDQSVIAYKAFLNETLSSLQDKRNRTKSLKENAQLDEKFQQANLQYLQSLTSKIDSILKSEGAKNSGFTQRYEAAKTEISNRSAGIPPEIQKLAAYHNAASNFPFREDTRLYKEFSTQAQALRTTIGAVIYDQELISATKDLKSLDIAKIKGFLNYRSPLLSEKQLAEDTDFLNPDFLIALANLPPEHHSTFKETFGKTHIETHGFLLAIANQKAAKDDLKKLNNAVLDRNKAIAQELADQETKDLKRYLNTPEAKKAYGLKDDIKVDGSTTDEAYISAFEKAVRFHAGKDTNGKFHELSGIPIIDYQAILLRYKDYAGFQDFKPSPDLTTADEKLFAAHAAVAKKIQTDLIADSEALKKIQFSEKHIEALKAKGFNLDYSKWPSALNDIKTDGIIKPTDAETVGFLRAAIAAGIVKQDDPLAQRYSNLYSPYFKGFIGNIPPDTLDAINVKIADNMPSGPDNGTPEKSTPDSKKPETSTQRDPKTPTGLGKLIEAKPEEAEAAIRAAQKALGFKEGDKTEGNTLAGIDWGKITRTADPSKPLLGNTEDPTLLALHNAYLAHYGQSTGNVHSSPDKVTPNEMMAFFTELYNQKASQIDDKKRRFAELATKHEAALKTVKETLDHVSEAARKQVISSLQDNDGELHQLRKKAEITKEDLAKTQIYKELSQAQGVDKSKLADDLWTLINDPAVFSYISEPSSETMFGESLDDSKKGLLDILSFAGLATYNATGKLPEALFGNDADNVPAIFKPENFDDRLFDPVVYDSLNSQGYVDASYLLKDPALKKIILSNPELSEKNVFSRQEVGKIAIERMEQVATLYKNADGSSIQPHQIAQAISDGRYVPYFGDLELAHEGFTPEKIHVPNEIKKALGDIGQDWRSPLNMKPWIDRAQDQGMIGKWGSIDDEKAFLFGQRRGMFARFGIELRNKDGSLLTLAQARAQVKSEELAAFNTEVENMKNESMYGFYSLEATDPTSEWNFRQQYQNMRHGDTYRERTLEIKRNGTGVSTEAKKAATLPTGAATSIEAHINNYKAAADATQTLITLYNDENISNEKLQKAAAEYLKTIKQLGPQKLYDETLRIFFSSEKSATGEIEKNIETALDSVQPALPNDVKVKLTTSLLELSKTYDTHNGRDQEYLKKTSERQTLKVDEACSLGKELCETKSATIATNTPAPTPEQQLGTAL